MRNILTYILFCVLIFQANSYDKLSIVEGFNNCSCLPGTTITNGWYYDTTTAMLNSGTISQIMYHVNWPSFNDPMYLFNSTDISHRIIYYNVFSIPWIGVNGNLVPYDSANFTNAVTNGNNEFAPFNIEIRTGLITDNTITVNFRIFRDISDTTNFINTKLKAALVEKQVNFITPPGSNGESIFYSICRKMISGGGGIGFEIPTAGGYIEISLQNTLSNDFFQIVNLSNLQVVVFIQNDSTKKIYQSNIEDWFNIPPAAIESNTSSNKIKQYQLLQNYPNPFNPSTKISYKINRPNHVRLIIYDVLGREVKIAVDEYQKAGEYSVVFDASKFPNGIYYYQIEIGNEYVETKKMLYIK